MIREKSQWTPGGMALWLIAAVVATLVVCSQTEPPAPASSARSSGGEIEVEIVE